MVSKKVLKNIGVFAMAVMLAAAPALAVSAGGSSQLLKSTTGSQDQGSTDPVTPSNPVSSGTKTTAPAPAPQVSNHVVVAGGGNKLVSTVEGVYTETVVDGVAVTTSKADVAAAFGAGEGAQIRLAVLNSSHGPAAEQCINDGLAGLAADNVNVVRGPAIDINAYLNGKKVIDIDNPVTVVVGVPESFRQAGYEYAVIRVQEGGRVSILTDKEPDSAIVAFDTTGFGVFVIVKAPAGSFDKYK